MAGAAYGFDEFQVASYPTVDFSLQAGLSGQKQAIVGKRSLMQSERPIATYTNAANIKR